MISPRNYTVPRSTLSNTRTRANQARAHRAYRRCQLALQAFIALGIEAAATFLVPVHAARGAVGLVGLPLLGAGVHARQARLFAGKFRIHHRRENGIAGLDRWQRRSGFLLRGLRCSRRRGWCGSRGGGGSGGRSGRGFRAALALRKSFHFWPLRVPAVLAA